MELESKILFKHWGIQDSINSESSGGSRSSWQVTNGCWLTRSKEDQAEIFRKETALFESLQQKLKDSEANWNIPTVVMSKNNSNIVQENNFYWRLTKNIEGIKFPAKDPRTYPALVKILGELHKALSLVPLSDTALDRGVIDGLQKNAHASSFPSSISKIYDWLLPKLDSIPQEKVFTHGDFNPTYIIYKEDKQNLEVVGILDFELSRPDPAVMDYSQLFTMLVCHSGFQDLKMETNKLVSELRGQFSHEELRLAMLAYWLDLYLVWSKVSEIAEKKILHRIDQVWSFLQIYS